MMAEKKKETISTMVLIITAVLAAVSVAVCAYTMATKSLPENTRLVLYEGPKSLKDAAAEDITPGSETKRDISLMHCTDTSVEVNGMEAYVYDANVNNTHLWNSNYMPSLSRTPVTYFDFEGAAKVKITLNGETELETAKVTPAAAGISPKVNKKDKTIEFIVKDPGPYIVELNGKVERAVHIFANPLEQSAPKKGDEGVVYIEPGEWNIENIQLKDGQTLYISGGAVVHGMVRSNSAENIKIMGRGIIDGSQYDTWKGQTAYPPINLENVSGVTIDGIVMLNSNAWVISALETKDATINNVKIVSCRPNGDGITLQSCQNVAVTDSFVRSWDDSLVVKNYGSSSEGITFTNMTLWTDLAQSMEIGYETNKGKKENATLKNVCFENITVLHNFHKPVISVHNADDALVSDISFKNIMVEDAQMGSGDAGDNDQLIDIAVVKNSGWSSTKERGNIRNIIIDGVKVLSGKASPSRIIGYDEKHTVQGVTISNLYILGKKITTFEAGGFKIDEKTTSNITIQ